MRPFVELFGASSFTSVPLGWELHQQGWVEWAEQLQTSLGRLLIKFIKNCNLKSKKKKTTGGETLGFHTLDI